MWPVTVEPETTAKLAGAVMATVGGVMSGLLTVTVTVVAVAVLPAASLATALSVWTPLSTAVVSQVTAYGLVVSAAPKLAPSSLNCTLVTPTLSDAFADTVSAAPSTVAPLAGAEIATVGGVESTPLT